MGGVKKGPTPTYDICDFALSWRITDGRARFVDLSGLNAVMVGSYRSSEPGMPWRVTMLVDDRATPEQQGAVADIFLGRAGGSTRLQYAQRILDVHAVRAARIELDHTPDRQSIRAGDSVIVRALEPVEAAQSITCGIPGHDRPGTELRADVMTVREPPFSWELRGRCAFAADFEYSSSVP